MRPAGESGAEVRPFTLDVPQRELDDLQARLGATRWPQELSGSGWAYGMPLDPLRELAEYWRSGYDWRAKEAELNTFPQFTTTIDGANVHFLHVRSPRPAALPILITHGWPGSVVEFLDVIGPLSADFDLVLPSIPGYGLSGPTEQPGWDVARIAGAWAELMRRLGYTRYGAQGGDWGHAITRELAATDPDHVVAIHLNTLLTPDDGSDLSPADRARVDTTAAALPEMSAYAALQSTRPQTLAYALTDSPVGQLAWIAEKFAEWSGSPEAIDRDRLLTNVMLYWLTRTAGSAARLYWEHAHTGRPARCQPRSTPVGVAVFAGDLAAPVRSLAERDNTIVHWSELERGGHFAAMEEPALFAADVRTFFSRYS